VERTAFLQAYKDIPFEQTASEVEKLEASDLKREHGGVRSRLSLPCAYLNSLWRVFQLGSSKVVGGARLIIDVSERSGMNALEIERESHH